MPDFVDDHGRIGRQIRLSDTMQRSDHNRGQLSARLGLDSLGGRYLYAGTGLVLLFLVASWIGQSRLAESRYQAIANAAKRQTVMTSTRGLIDQVWVLDTAMQSFLLNPAPGQHNAITQTVAGMKATVVSLKRSAWLSRHPESEASVERLTADVDAIASELAELIEIRQNNTKMFPASRIFSETMTPANTRFYAAATEAIDEARSLEKRPGQGHVLQLFTEIRQYWTLMIGAFRNMVANRSGIFDNPEAGMQGQMQNIANYKQHIEDLMSDLVQLEGATKLGFIEEDSLGEMRRAAKEWERGYLAATAILYTDGWRRDIPLLQSKVLPRFTRLWSDIQVLEGELDDATLHDIRVLTSAADTLSGAIWLIALAGVAVVSGGYIFFRLTVLDPMSRVADALDVEAEGAPEPPTLNASTRETRRLIAAFEKMRTQTRARHRKLDRMAHHDHLTGLPNRTLFRDRLQHALTRATRRKRMVGLLFLDLDRFKELNDSRGHIIGDRLLRAVAARLTRCVRKGDTVARLAGDEFTVILEDIEDANSAAAVAEKILQALASPFALDGVPATISASIGIALFPLDASDSDVLIERADTAMYAAKASGRGRHQFFHKQQPTTVTQLD